MSIRDDLAALQETDSAIDRLRHAIARLPERAAAQEAAARLRALRDARASAETDRLAAEAELEGLEADTAELDRQRTRLEAQMKTIISPREAEALQHELATLAERRSVLDDRGLELLETMSEADGRESAAIAAEPEAVDASTAADEALAAAEDRLEHEIAALDPVRRAAAEKVDPAMLARYESMRPQREGVAVARLQGSRCSGCHLDLSVGEADELRRVPDDRVPECPSCGRLLVP